MRPAGKKDRLQREADRKGGNERGKAHQAEDVREGVSVEEATEGDEMVEMEEEEEMVEMEAGDDDDEEVVEVEVEGEEEEGGVGGLWKKACLRSASAHGRCLGS